MLRPVSTRRQRLRRFAVPLAAVAAVGVAVPAAYAVSRVGVTVHGPADGALVGKDRLDHLQYRVVSNRAVRLTLDGHRVHGTRAGKAVVYEPRGLPDGRHVLKIQADGRIPMVHTTVARSFVVDTKPPTLHLDTPNATSLRAPVTVHGSTDAKSVQVDGKTVAVKDGTFTVDFPTAPAGVPVVAKDAAGNETTQLLDVAVVHPMMRGVHMTPDAWAYAPLREPVLAMARQHLINTVELDVKDEEGLVGFKSRVPLATQVGATGGTTYDPAKVIAQLHQMGLRVVGRLVAFRDPKLATWAWTHGHRDWVVQTPDGQPWAGTYGKASFTNVGNEQVRKYNEEIAAEAAQDGFDDVMYDYVRRPDGPIAKMKFPGLTVSPEQAVAEFVRDTRGPVRKAGAFLGAAVFGVSATRPAEVGQNIPIMAKYVDYVSPMVYPSHWAQGEYNVANPNAQPYDIVQRSLKDFLAKVKGTNCQVMPWLQDFSLGVTYGVPQVQAQIKAAHDDGIDSFLLWNAGATYHAGSFSPLG